MSGTEAQFWKRSLEGAPALTEAPMDRQRLAQAFQGHCANVRQQFPFDLQDKIHRFTEKSGVECFLAAVWQARLHFPGRSLARVCHIAVYSQALKCGKWDQKHSLAISDIPGLQWALLQSSSCLDRDAWQCLWEPLRVPMTSIGRQCRKYT